jgi:Lipid A 3-O-deacylase (PagL)
MKRVFAACGLVLLLLAPRMRGGVAQPLATPTQQEVKDMFAAGAKEFEAVSGAFFFFDTTKNNRPAIDYSLETLRLGVMLNDPWQLGLLSGNFELMGELFGGGVFDGPGDVLLGGSLVFRYNFVQPRERIIPYMQIAAGGVYTNIPEKESRGLISLPVEFNLQAGVGTRILLDDRWSLIIEGDYRHISNAEIKKPNFGIDSVGGNLGFGFSF